MNWPTNKKNTRSCLLNFGKIKLKYPYSGLWLYGNSLHFHLKYMSKYLQFISIFLSFTTTGFNAACQGSCDFNRDSTINTLKRKGVDTFFVYYPYYRICTGHSDADIDVQNSLKIALPAEIAINSNGDTIKIQHPIPDSILVLNPAYNNCSENSNAGFLFYKQAGKMFVIKMNACYQFQPVEVSNKLIINTILRYKKIVNEKYRFYLGLASMSSHPATYALDWFIKEKSYSKGVYYDEINQERNPYNTTILKYNKNLLTTVLIKALDKYILDAEKKNEFAVLCKKEQYMKIKNPYKANQP